jgi:hypothetical protein
MYRVSHTMFTGTHRSRVHIHVRVDLDGGDFQTHRFEQQSSRGR